MDRTFPLIVTFVVMLSVSEAKSAECVKNFSNQIRIGELLSCIAQMNNEIEVMKEMIPPKGSVLILDNANGCPYGWHDFDVANGRVIVGAQRKYSHHQPPTTRQFRELGGVEAVELKEEHLPRHDHGIRNALNGRPLPWGPGSHPVPTSVSAGSDTLHDWSAGGGQVHTNMPPYIALYFCKKG